MTGTERKVFQKYYPPDFDPSKIPKAKGRKNHQFVQRVMAPFNMQCNTCHEYVYKGKKFNMRRETAEGEFYLGLKIFRFYFRCPNCLAEFTFKTDLENCDYVMEHGATRLFEAFKLYQEQIKAKEAKEEAEKRDPMKMLEKRTHASRKELEAIGKLEELQEMNRRSEAVDTMGYLAETGSMMSYAQMMKLQEEKDEEYVQTIYGRMEDGKRIIRIKDEDEDEQDKGLEMKSVPRLLDTMFTSPLPPKIKLEEPSEDDDNFFNQPSTSSNKSDWISPPVPSTMAPLRPPPAAAAAKKDLDHQRAMLQKMVVVKKKTPVEQQDSMPKPKEEKKNDGDGKSALCGLAGYGSSSGDDDSE